MEQNIEVDATGPGMGRRESTGRVAGCSSCPISEEGGLRHCDNWRGISLLDVVGKTMARIMKERLEVIAGKVLPKHNQSLYSICFL